jgi:hypothetical protein
VENESAGRADYLRELLTRTAARVLNFRLPDFVLLPLGLADDECAATHVLRFVELIFRHNFFFFGQNFFS